MKYKLLDNGKDAVYTDTDDTTWQNCVYDTFDEAVAYAKDWLGFYFKPQHKWKLNENYYYGPHPNHVTIVAIDN